MHCRLAYVGPWFALSLAIGCEPETNPVATSVADAAPSVDGGSPSVPPPMDAAVQVDAATLDAPYAVRLAYFATLAASPSEYVDLCVRSPGGMWRKVYGAPGIGRGQVGRYDALDRNDWTLRVINVSDTCEGTALQEVVYRIGVDSAVNRSTLTVREGLGGATTEGRNNRYRREDIVGLDEVSIFDLIPANKPHALSLDDGTTPVLLNTAGKFARLPAAKLASLRVDFSLASSTDVDLPYKAGDGVGTIGFLTESPTGISVLYCDEFAPPDGLLSRCSPTLRAP